MLKKLPIGVDIFEKLRKNQFYYVDKTMLIAEFLENWGEVTLFTRPRRFGKTLTMSMLKSFFEIGCDRTLFDGLAISREKALCEEFMGRFPVIFITLKEIAQKTYEESKEQLQMVIGTEAERFGFLAKSPRLTENEKEKYQALIRLENGCYTMEDVVLRNSLLTLTQLLAKHYGEKAILLIDEYDVPLDKAYQGGYYDDMVSLIRNMFSSVLKTNADLKFAVVTGCLRISKESIFTGLNNLSVMTITDEEFRDGFGFTEEEVVELLAYYGLEEKLPVMREWYDGYLFGNTSVYCPWDVLRYVRTLRRNRSALPESYWANTSSNNMIRHFIDQADQRTRDELERLLAGEAIEKEIVQELTYRDLDGDIEHLWSILLMTGYLTVEERISADRYRLAIPNAEVTVLFQKQVKKWFENKVKSAPEELEHFCSAVISGDTGKVQVMLTDYLADTISIRDYSAKTGKKENFYHGLLLGLFSCASNWSIKSNSESGGGYCDIEILDRASSTGVIIEIKYADTGKLDDACDKALEQIEKRSYEAGVKSEGMKNIIKYGMAFYRKQCRIVKAQSKFGMMTK